MVEILQMLFQQKSILSQRNDSFVLNTKAVIHLYYLPSQISQ